MTIAHSMGARQMFQAGAEWARDHYEGTNRVRDEATGHETDTIVGWAQHRWSVTNRLSTTVGARVDRRSVVVLGPLIRRILVIGVRAW